MSGMFGYSDFIFLFRVDDPADLAPGLEVRSDGVYVKPMDDASLLHWSERAVLAVHRTGNLSEPTMPFPFSLSDLKEFCDRHEGMHHAMLPFDLAELAAREAREGVAACRTPQGASADGDQAGSRSRSTMLRVIRALSVMAELPERGAVDSVSKQLDELGFKSPKEATIRNLLTAARELEPD